MSQLTEAVTVTVTSTSANPTQAGFGLPLIISNSGDWAGNLIRSYATITDVLVDFATTTAEYKKALALFAQNPRPPAVLIARVATARRITTRWAVTPSAVNGATYKISANGTEVSFTADSSATVAEIIAGLKAALDALAIAITTSDQTTYLRILDNVAGHFFSISCTDPNLAIAQDHTDPGIATDLAAFKLERNDWYYLLTDHNSKETVLAAAAWVEAEKKMYRTITNDSAVINTTVSGTDDVAEALKALGYLQTELIHSFSSANMVDAAIVGRTAPITPGREVSAWKQLAGVSVGSYTNTQIDNMKAKAVSWYDTTGGLGVFQQGKAIAGTRYIDFTRWVDYIIARNQERFFGSLASGDKLPFNQRGINTIENEANGLMALEEQGEAILPGWIVTAPKVSEVTTGDRNTRTLNGLKETCVYAGGIQRVNVTIAVSGN